MVLVKPTRSLTEGRGSGPRKTSYDPRKPADIDAKNTHERKSGERDEPVNNQTEPVNNQTKTHLKHRSLEGQGGEQHSRLQTSRGSLNGHSIHTAEGQGGRWDLTAASRTKGSRMPYGENDRGPRKRGNTTGKRQKVRTSTGTRWTGLQTKARGNRAISQRKIPNVFKNKQSNPTTSP